MNVAASSDCSLWLDESLRTTPNMTAPRCRGISTRGPLGDCAIGNMYAHGATRDGSEIEPASSVGAYELANMLKLWWRAHRHPKYAAHG